MRLTADGKERLDRFLSRSMPGHSRSKIEKLIEEKGVLVQGERHHKGGLMLRAGWEVVAEEPKETPPHDLAPVSMALEAAWEDEHVVIVNKPRGLAVHPAPGLFEPTLVHGLLARGHGLSGEGGDFRPGIVHRLDKETTGLLMVAKSDAAHRSLAAQIQAKTAGRRYVAVVKALPKESSMTIQAPIGRHPSSPVLRAIRADGKEAVTHVLGLGRIDEGGVVACRLETGRTHQIRVHLAGIGCPVLGDFLYAPAPYNRGPLQLHAAWVSFDHPLSGERISVYSDPPADFLGRERVDRTTIGQWTARGRQPGSG
jgi:23S rRNA pseudouridine1911/1915/1917 synthase